MSKHPAKPYMNKCIWLENVDLGVLHLDPHVPVKSALLATTKTQEKMGKLGTNEQSELKVCFEMRPQLTLLAISSGIYLFLTL